MNENQEEYSPAPDMPMKDRDMIACVAMHAIIVGSINDLLKQAQASGREASKIVANFSYAVADEMLKKSSEQ